MTGLYGDVKTREDRLGKPQGINLHSVFEFIIKTTLLTIALILLGLFSGAMGVKK